MYVSLFRLTEVRLESQAHKGRPLEGGFGNFSLRAIHRRLASRRTGGRWSLPILQFQTGNAAEFPGVMSHQGQPVRQRNRRDQQVVRADKHAQTGQVCSNPAVLFGCEIIKGQRLKLTTKDLNLAQVLLLARASVCVL